MVVVHASGCLAAIGDIGAIQLSSEDMRGAPVRLESVDHLHQICTGSRPQTTLHTELGPVVSAKAGGSDGGIDLR